jgi:hypothetical protein
VNVLEGSDVARSLATGPIDYIGQKSRLPDVGAEEGDAIPAENDAGGARWIGRTSFQAQGPGHRVAHEFVLADDNLDLLGTVGVLPRPHEGRRIWGQTRVGPAGKKHGADTVILNPEGRNQAPILNKVLVDVRMTDDGPGLIQTSEFGDQAFLELKPRVIKIEVLFEVY